jgi:hypothetical protein
MGRSRSGERVVPQGNVLSFVLIVFSICLVPSLLFLHWEVGLDSLLRCLPRDEEMIRNFREHREGFERLVRAFRHDSSLPFDALGQCMVPTPTVAGIMKYVGVDKLCTDRTKWMPPDPYAESARSRGCYSKASYRELSGIRFVYGHGDVIRLNTLLPAVSKLYYYIPLEPEIEDGRLKIPYPGGPLGKAYLSDNLNEYPPDFESSDCAYRKIEPHWFIELCQGK